MSVRCREKTRGRKSENKSSEGEVKGRSRYFAEETAEEYA
jgi:hypothetical protein